MGETLDWGANTYPGVQSACGACGRPLKADWKGSCRHCGAAYADAVPVSMVDKPTFPSPTPTSGPLRPVTLFVSVVGLIVAFAAFIAINSPEPGGQPWNIPAGFAALEGNEAVAARFATPTECSSAACVDLEVIARDGCPGGINVKALTGGGEGEINGLVLNQIDDPVAPMEIAVLPLTFEEPDVSQVRFEVFCYPE